MEEGNKIKWLEETVAQSWPREVCYSSQFDCVI